MLILSFYGFWPFGDNLCIVFILGDFIGGNISIITLTIISHHRLRCIRQPYGMKKCTTFEMLLPALIIWPVIITFWTLPTILIIKNQKYRSQYYNLRYCYFMFSFEYVLIVDLVAYCLPIFLLVYFQVSIYFALKTKKSLIKPIQQKNRLLTKLITHSQAVSSNSNGFVTHLLPLQQTNENKNNLILVSCDNINKNNNCSDKNLAQKKISNSYSENNSQTNEVLNSNNHFLERKGSGELFQVSMITKKAPAMRMNSNNQKNNNTKEKFVKALKFRLFKTQLNLINQQILLTNNYTKNK
jgi:hypothetical protein